MTIQTTRQVRTGALALVLAAVIAFSAATAGIAGAATTTDLAVSITDDDNTLEPGETTTVEIAVANAAGGVGAAELGVELSDPGVATITDVSVLNDPGSTDNAVAGGGQSADVKYAFADSADSGVVTIVEVTLQAAAAGSTGVDVVQNGGTGNLVVFDESGAGYTLDSVGSTTLTVAEPPPGNGPPTADAGADQTVEEGQSVTLDASDSSDPDGDALSYDWAVTDAAGTGVTLTDDDTATPSFAAPEVDADTTLTFQVDVSDGNGGSDTDSVSVTVTDADAGGAKTTDLSASIADDTIAPGETTTVDVAVTDAAGGVGAAELGVELGDPGVATITDVSVLNDPGSTDNAVAGGAADVKYAFADSADTGTVTIVEVTLQAAAPGSTDVEIVQNGGTGNLVVFDESGAGYTLDSVGSATLTVEEPGTGPPAAPSTAVQLVSTDDDGQIGVGGTNTYDVVVTDAVGGVGAFSLTVSSSDTGVATVTDAAVVPGTSDGMATTDVEVTDSTATMEAALLDTADSGSVTVGTVTLTGQGAGTADVSLSVDALGDEAGRSYDVSGEDGASITVVEIVQVDPSYAGLPTDVDGDGAYEDVNGDGDLTVADVQALWAHRDASTVTDFPDAYDFNADGTFDVVDVQALWDELNG